MVGKSAEDTLVFKEIRNLKVAPLRRSSGGSITGGQGMALLGRSVTDILDTVISLRNPKDYNPQDGANFEVHFEKSRGIYGEDVKPFEAKLETDATGNATWTIKSLEDSTYIKVVTLFKEGLSQKEIAEDLGIHKSNVSRAVKRAKDNGEL